MAKTGTAVTAAVSAAATAAMLLWAMPAITDGGQPADAFGPDTRDAPGSWYSETSERLYGIRTESEYGTIHTDCILRMAKDGTGTDAVSFWLNMECDGEHGIPSTYGNSTNRFHRMTVPADFEVSWPDSGRCDMSLSHTAWDYKAAIDTSVLITCND